MKIFFIILLYLLLQCNFLKLENYENSKICITIKPNGKEDCHKIPSDHSVENNNQEIACCFTSYNSEGEGSVNKCVPIFKTLNGIHMYEQQIENVGGNSITIDCFSKRTIINILMLNILLYLII